LGAIGADRQHVQAIRTAFEGPDGVRSHANGIPRHELDDLVIELYPAGTADDDIQLFLLAVTVSHGAPEARPVAEQADAEMLGVEIFPREARFDPGAPPSLNFLEVDF